MKKILKIYKTQLWLFTWVTFYLFILLSIYIYTNNLNTQYFKPVINQKTSFDIYPTTSYDKLVVELKEEFNITDNIFFNSFIKKKNLSQFKPGRYILDSLFSFNDIINEIRVAENRSKANINFTFNASNNFDLISANYLKTFPSKKDSNFTYYHKSIDSIDFINTIYNYDYNRYFDISKDNNLVKALFIPNTYQYEWHGTIKDFISITLYNYDKFWADSNTLAKLDDLSIKWKNIKLNSIDVSILASIVYKEAKFEDEYERIAGLYLNRLEKGIKLQADPTVNYAFQERYGFDTTLNRVYEKHFEINSKYNTYMYEGLPPAPICIPSKQAIEAVLNAEKHEYLYMCAKVEIDESNKYIYFPGLHSFSKTYKSHKTFAKKYQFALNKIKKDNKRAKKIYKICYDNINNCYK